MELEKFEDAKFLRVSAGVRYWEDTEINGIEDNANEPQIQFVNEVETVDGTKKYWQPIIDLDKGQVEGWNTGTSALVHYKVCDDGHYELLNANREVIATADDWRGGSYVPPVLDCSEDKYSFGDYIILPIDREGFIERFEKNFFNFKRV